VGDPTPLARSVTVADFRVGSKVKLETNLVLLGMIVSGDSNESSQS
jgi:hypothetical protein